MADADVLIKAFFFQYGKPAPKNSEFKSVITDKTLFGGFFSYTGREDATKDSIDTNDKEASSQKEDASFSGYTSRENATKNSGKDYFTMSNAGKLFTKEQREAWERDARKAFSIDGDIAWSFVVSLKDYELLERYGLHDQNDMAAVANIALRKSFARMHLDASNMIWWEDYHTNTDHPHMHITFMEKETSRTRGKLTAKEINAVKTAFFTELAARKTYYEKYRQDSAEALKEVTPLRKNVVSSAKHLSYESIQSIADLYQMLPEGGRLQYNSTFMIPYRKKLDNIVTELLNREEVKPDFEKFKDHVLRISENINDVGNENVSNFWQSQYDKLKVQIANSVLAEFKNYRKEGLEKAGDLKPWTPAKCSNEIAKISTEILGKQESTLPEKIAAAAMIAGDLETAKQTAEKITNAETAEFVKNSLDLMNKQSDADAKTKAQDSLRKSASKGNPYCQRLYARNTKTYPLVKSTFRNLERALRPSMIHHASKCISDQGRKLDEEIWAYLHNKDDVEDTVEQDRYSRNM